MGILSSHISHVSTVSLSPIPGTGEGMRAVPGKLPGRVPSCLCSMYLRIKPSASGTAPLPPGYPISFRSEGQEEVP